MIPNILRHFAILISLSNKYIVILDSPLVRSMKIDFLIIFGIDLLHCLFQEIFKLFFISSEIWKILTDSPLNFFSYKYMVKCKVAFRILQTWVQILILIFKYQLLKFIYLLIIFLSEYK